MGFVATIPPRRVDPAHQTNLKGAVVFVNRELRDESLIHETVLRQPSSRVWRRKVRRGLARLVEMRGRAHRKASSWREFVAR